ncbi:hypothetical protein I7I48_01757 [Histoplasma ohiense]|nr:hypothetical protein I7I48_01757 [Histoplasma ohiense (nom. inval.)]
MTVLSAALISAATASEASRGVPVPSVSIHFFLLIVMAVNVLQLLLTSLCVHLFLLLSQILSPLVHPSPLSIPLLLFLQLSLSEHPSLISVEIQALTQLLCSLSSHPLLFWPVFLCVCMPIVLLASL